MSSSQLYKVRGQSGQVCFEGDLASLRAWLADNRIDSDFEVQRQGLEVLHGERLWSLVRERPELGFDPAVERLRNERLRIWLWWGLASCAITLILGAFLAYQSFMLPAIDVGAAKRGLERAHEGRLAEMRKEISAEISELRRMLREDDASDVAAVSELRASIDKLDGMSGVHARKIADSAQMSAGLESRLLKLESGLAAIGAEARPGVSVPEARGARTASTASDPKVSSSIVAVAWSNTAVDGYKFIKVTNRTTSSMAVSISYRYGGVTPSVMHVLIPAGETYDSGSDSQMSVASGGRRAFVSGNEVSISFDLDASWRGYGPIVTKTP